MVIYMFGRWNWMVWCIVTIAIFYYCEGFWGFSFGFWGFVSGFGLLMYMYMFCSLLIHFTELGDGKSRIFAELNFRKFPNSCNKNLVCGSLECNNSKTTNFGYIGLLFSLPESDPLKSCLHCLCRWIPSINMPNH